MLRVKINMSDFDTMLKVRGLDPYGHVQQFIDTEFIKHCEPYVPRDTGMLAESAWLSTAIGSGEVVYNTPYAAKVYSSPELNFQGAPMRGAYWALRMWADRGKEIMDGAAKIAGGRTE